MAPDPGGDASTTPEQTGSSGRQNNQSSRRNGNRSSNQQPRQGNFQGSTPELKDYVYDITNKHKDAFPRTTKAIGEFIARTCKGGGEFINAFDPDDLGFDPIMDPTPPINPADVIEMKKWEGQLRRTQKLEEVREDVSK